MERSQRSSRRSLRRVTCTGLAAVLLACGGGTEVIVDESGAGPPSTAVDVEHDGASWVRVEDPDGALGVHGSSSVHLADIVAAGPGYLAVGSFGEGAYGELGTVAAMWTSSDGTTWERVPHDDAVFGAPGSGRFTVATAATTGGPGVVVVGMEARGEAMVALAWLSEDGRSWTRVEVDDPRDRGATDVQPLAVAATDEGLVAVGIERGGASGAPEAPAAWWSQDGLTWVPVPLDPSEDAGTWGYLSTLVAHEDGVVAAGMSGHPDGRGWVAAVWQGSGADGLTRIPHDDAVFGGQGMPWIHGLATTGQGLVAVGSVDAHHLDDPRWSPAAVWTSTDGLAWQRVQHDDEVFGIDDHAAMLDVVATGHGLVAVGHGLTDGEDPMAARHGGVVWTSPDGTTWTQLADADGVFSADGYTTLHAVTAGPSGLVVVGGVGGEDAGTIGAVWIGR